MIVDVDDRHREDEELLRRRRTRNWTLAGALLGFVVIVYLVSLVRMGGL